MSVRAWNKAVARMGVSNVLLNTCVRCYICDFSIPHVCVVTSVTLAYPKNGRLRRTACFKMGKKC